MILRDPAGCDGAEPRVLPRPRRCFPAVCFPAEQSPQQAFSAGAGRVSDGTDGGPSRSQLCEMQLPAPGPWENLDPKRYSQSGLALIHLTHTRQVQVPGINVFSANALKNTP